MILFIPSLSHLNPCPFGPVFSGGPCTLASPRLGAKTCSRQSSDYSRHGGGHPGAQAPFSALRSRSKAPFLIAS